MGIRDLPVSVREYSTFGEISGTDGCERAAGLAMAFRGGWARTGDSAIIQPSPHTALVNGMPPGRDLASMLLDGISDGESQRLEFKGEDPENMRFLKTVVAFSNGTGGLLLFGVADDGSIEGVPDDELFRTKDAIANSISSACKPTIAPDIFNVTVEGRNIIVVDVMPGKETPYYLASEGMEQGTYVRIGGITKNAGPDMIRSLMIRGSNESFDRLECPSVTVDEGGLSRLCRRLSGYRQEITPVRLENMQVLISGLRGYTATNAYALLTSNPFPQARVQCACFRDEKGLEFADSLDLEGDIVTRAEGALEFVMRHMRKSSEISGLVRKDTYEIPEIAVREAIVNAIIHRDYSLQSSSIFVRVFRDRVEVESPGQPLVDLSIIGTGRSEIRNQAIASVFKAMGLIEKYGTGIRRMIEECEAQGDEPPLFEDNSGYFKVTFPRPVPVRQTGDNASAIIERIRDDPSLTQSEIAQATGISESIVKKTMAKLKAEGRISRKGSRRSGTWEIRDHNDA